MSVTIGENCSTACSRWRRSWGSSMRAEMVEHAHNWPIFNAWVGRILERDLMPCGPTSPTLKLRFSLARGLWVTSGRMAQAAHDDAKSSGVHAKLPDMVFSTASFACNRAEPKTWPRRSPQGVRALQRTARKQDRRRLAQDVATKMCLITFHAIARGGSFFSD